MHLGMKKLQLSASMLSAALFASSCVAVDESQDIATSQNENQIVGGQATTIEQNPWQVFVQIRTGNGQANVCGGSIVSKDWILTAQHCTVGHTADKIDVLAGAAIAAQSTQGRGVSEIISVPGYNTANNGKDMALLHLAKPLDINDSTVKPIVMLMPSQALYASDGLIARVTGWGHLASGGSSPEVLQTVNLSLVNLEQAKVAYGQALSDDQLSASGLGKDSCQGDSGGPLTVEGPNGRVLAGVVSWGRGCADPKFPGMYARVTYYYDWVKGVTGIADPVTPPSDPGTGGGDNGGGGDDGSLDGSANDGNAVQGGCNAGALGAAGGAELLLVIAAFLGLRRRAKSQA
jgi:secreted trypsin-like serine protease